jgi:hypothetical protein
MSTVLRNQVKAAKQSADELLQGAHRDAMFCSEVEDLIKTYVELYQRARAAIQHWQDRARNAKPEDAGALAQWKAFWADHFRPFDHLLREMLEGFRLSADLVAASENTGHWVDGQSAFVSAFDELRLAAAFDYDRVVAAGRSERTRPLSTAELRDGLRRRMDGNR